MGIDHETVIRSHTPERYILGELPPPEREEFEDHLSDCTVCMQELAAADLFAANASAVFADAAREKAAEKSSGWFGFLRPRAFPVLAFSGVLNLALLGFVGYGVMRMASVSEPQPGVSEMFTVRPPARAAQSQVCAVDKSSAFATFRFDLARPFRRYSYSLEGVRKSSVAVKGPSPASETLNLTVSVAGLKPGDHKFQVMGSDDERTVEIGECILRVAPDK